MPKSNSVFAKFIKDPLIHFLILGGLLFALVSAGNGKTRAQDEIIITKTTQKHLADLFEITWQRKPTPDELKNLTEEHIKEEIYYREALALGLDDNDTIVRRRMRQKLEFMQEDLSSLVEPSEAELMTYYETNKDKYKTDHILSFKQVLLSPKKLEAGASEVTQVLTMLKKGASPESLSHSTLLPVSMKLETSRAVTNIFGADFLKSTLELKPDMWLGPIHSSFGTHFVNLNLNQRAKPQTFIQVRDKVSVDYIQAQREKSAANYYNNLRSQYRVIVEDTE